MIVKKLEKYSLTQRKSSLLQVTIFLRAYGHAEQIHLLDRLPRVVDAKYDPARCCLSGTRTQVINSILGWASGKGKPGANILWFHGLAGSGKSTIATSVARDLSERQWLGGSFFFSRDAIVRSKADQLFSTISFHLASFDASFADRICDSVAADLDVGRSSLSNQFAELVQKPLASVQCFSRPVVFVLDALDECGSEKERKDLLTLIRNGLADLPDFVKFIISSRPDADIRALFKSMGAQVEFYDLGSLQGSDVDIDILALIRSRMREIAQAYELAEDWPGSEKCQALLQEAKGLFIWAFTACEFIDDDESDGPDEQLRVILNKSAALPTLDELYLRVLRQALSSHASANRLANLQIILGAIVAAMDPLTPCDLAALLDISGSTRLASGKAVKDVVRKLHSVLIIPTAEDEVLRIIHPSFVDFITDESRCADARFFVRTGSQHLYLAKRCLRHMQLHLHRDMCQMGIGPCMNEDVSEHHIFRSIPGDLKYACRFWAEHIHRTEVDSELYALVAGFAFEHLLHWMEVMSLINMHDETISALLSVRASLKVPTASFD